MMRIRTGLLAVVLALSLGACSTTKWQPAPVENRSRIAVPVERERGAFRATYYKVKAGDTLYGIAWAAGQDFRTLARWSGIKPPYTIYPGQMVRLRPPPEPVLANRKDARPKPVARPRRPATIDRTRPVDPPASEPKASRDKSEKAVDASPGRVAAPSPKTPRSGPLRWSWPHQGKIVARFRKSDPLKQGIKLSGREGDRVLAAESGRVVYSGGGLIGYGRLIIVKHNDNYLSAYGHNRKLLAREGDRVTKGQQLAEIGRDTTGNPLLHFEIRRDGKPINPMRVLPRR